mmetsp:Transcript_34626/g.87024  ORF Transcript_34626/g.87024 Transcript_34626/m.87024 type:complete len:207 (+) Transcript_34626:4094-4714(+)
MLVKVAMPVSAAVVASTTVVGVRKNTFNPPMGVLGSGAPSALRSSRMVALMVWDLSMGMWAAAPAVIAFAALRTAAVPTAAVLMSKLAIGFTMSNPSGLVDVPYVSFPELHRFVKAAIPVTAVAFSPIGNGVCVAVSGQSDSTLLSRTSRLGRNVSPAWQVVPKLVFAWHTLMSCATGAMTPAIKMSTARLAVPPVAVFNIHAVTL